MKYNGIEFEAVVATPACGKSFLCDKYPEIFVDMDEVRLKHKYIVPKDITREEYEKTKGARKFEHRMKESEFIPAIYDLFDEKLRQGKILIASPHPEFYQYFQSRGIKFCLVYADKEMKEEIKRRYLKRGNPTDVAEKEYNKFESYYQGNIEEQRAAVKYAFGKDEFLEQILIKFGLKLP